jgi:hypothetical protein
MNKKVILRKYSWKEKQWLYPNPLEGIIDFKVDGQKIITQGNFLTTNSFTSPQEAQEYCSLSYCPRFLYELGNGQILQNPSYNFVNIYGHPKSASRVWPAFGKHGGGCEIILTNGCLQCGSSERFDEGGASDEFHLDSMLSDILAVAVNGFIMEIFYAWFKDNVKNDKAYKTIRGKIDYSSGIVIGWYDDEIRKRYAISCGCKEEKQFGGGSIITELKFWGYAWEDQDYDNKRFLVSAAPCILPVPLSSSDKRVIRTEMEKEIEDAISKIYNQITNLSYSFDSNRQEIYIPDSDDLECLSRAGWE